jgi:hypothetical protein
MFLYQYQYQKTIIFHIQYLTYTATIYSSQKKIYLCTGYLPGPWFEKGSQDIYGLPSSDESWDYFMHNESNWWLGKCSRHGFLHQRMNANGSDTK